MCLGNGGFADEVILYAVLSMKGERLVAERSLGCVRAKHGGCWDPPADGVSQVVLPGLPPQWRASGVICEIREREKTKNKK